ncbi:NAD(P)-dependent oxidoreductase [Afifella sp. IM 167]|uniref:NAD(P)-dependent oxidoreductase n=1 Tax=Afifella sp. IM 167 TaxID=2033586 RepID=UPI001CCA2CF0|nr:NAD(P)-dependent oxidoreductase [Afifella sp. IM 167]MBZ8134359.1 oxidoreductase [Afifella sp. IM 167]
MSAALAFIGLGTMGGPMAARLAQAGFTVRGYDIDPAKTRALEEAGGTAASSIADACAGASIALTILPRDAHVETAALGPGGLRESLPKGALLIEMSTISPTTSLAVAAALSEAGIRMMDAPVGRTPADAARGTLLVMAGGEASDFAEATPVFEAFSDKALHMGPLGSGIRMKVANNYMSMVTMALTAETLALAGKAGIDEKMAVEVLQNTVAGRGQINVNYPRKVLAGDITPDFPLVLGEKDISLGLALGHDLKVPLFLGAAARELFGLAPAMDLAQADCTALLLILEKLAGIESPPRGGKG